MRAISSYHPAISFPPSVPKKKHQLGDILVKGLHVVETECSILSGFNWVVLVNFFPLLHPQTGDWITKRLYIQPFRCDETPAQDIILIQCQSGAPRISSFFRAPLYIYILPRNFSADSPAFLKNWCRLMSWESKGMGLFRDNEGSWPLSKASFPADGY